MCEDVEGNRVNTSKIGWAKAWGFKFTRLELNGIKFAKIHNSFANQTPQLSYYPLGGWFASKIIYIRYNANMPKSTDIHNSLQLISTCEIDTQK